MLVAHPDDHQDYCMLLVLYLVTKIDKTMSELILNPNSFFLFKQFNIFIWFFWFSFYHNKQQQRDIYGRTRNGGHNIFSRGK